MVSFSCDHCQDVCKGAKVPGHFSRCRTQSMSCIDCGASFNDRTVSQHRSCITEAEKYEGRGKSGDRRPNSNSYCGTCDRKLPGLVAAEQHYTSKKHRAQERRLNVQNKAKKTPQKVDSTSPGQRVGVPEKAESPVNVGRKKPKLKRIMKKVLQSAPKNRLRQQALIKAVAAALDGGPDDINVRVPKIATKSRRFSVGKYILLNPKRG